MSIKDLRAQFEKNQAATEAPVEPVSTKPSAVKSSRNSVAYQPKNESNPQSAEKKPAPVSPRKPTDDLPNPSASEVKTPEISSPTKAHVETPVTPKSKPKETPALVTPKVRPVSPALADNKFLKAEKSPKYSHKVPFVGDFYGFIPPAKKDSFQAPKQAPPVGEIKLKTDDFYGYIPSAKKDEFKAHDKPSTTVPISTLHTGDFYGYIAPSTHDEFKPHDRPSTPVPVSTLHTGDFNGYVPVKPKEEFHVPTAKASDPLPLFAGDFYGYVPSKHGHDDTVSSSPRRSSSSIRHVEDPNMFGYVPTPNSPRRGEWAANHPHEAFHIRTPEQEEETVS